ncbi:MAG: MFS transporter [Methanobacteriota archaeon]
MAPRRPKGMAAFTIIWSGQLVSMLGSTMTGFALSLWAWEMTGQATALALVMFCSFAPMMIMTPVAGALVDRWNLKTSMILSDLTAGMGTVATLALYWTGNLQIWHLYILAAFIGTFAAFQWPAWGAAVSTLVDKKHYARTSGMMAAAESASGIFGPPIAVLFILMFSYSGVFVFDILTFCFAIGTLLAVTVPQPEKSADLGKGVRGVLKDSLYGFKFIRERKPLLSLQMSFFVINMIAAPVMILMTPMVLARTASDGVVLATVQAAMSAGGVIGGIVLAVWGGPKKRIYGLLVSDFFLGLGITLTLGLGRGIVVWTAGGFLTMLFLPIGNGSSQAIWQSKVPPNKQGRVFAARRLIAQASMAIAMILAGPLADGYFEPSMAEGGSLVSTFGGLVGSGPGAGMALMIFFCGLAATLAVPIFYLMPSVRNVETLVPDFDAANAVSLHEQGGRLATEDHPTEKRNPEEEKANKGAAGGLP